MDMRDKFGNEIRGLTPEENKVYLPLLRKRLFKRCAVAVVYTILVAFLTWRFMRMAPEYYIALLAGVIFGGTIAFLCISLAVEVYNVLLGNVGVIHIYSEDVQSSYSKSKKPRYFIQASDTQSEKIICYSVSSDEYFTLIDHFGHLREIDYIVVNPKRIKYKSYFSFIKLNNSGMPVIESAVYDNIDKSVDLTDGFVLSAKRKK